MCVLSPTELASWGGELQRRPHETESICIYGHEAPSFLSPLIVGTRAGGVPRRTRLQGAPPVLRPTHPHPKLRSTGRQAPGRSRRQCKTPSLDRGRQTPWRSRRLHGARQLRFIGRWDGRGVVQPRLTGAPTASGWATERLAAIGHSKAVQTIGPPQAHTLGVAIGCAIGALPARGTGGHGCMLRESQDASKQSPMACMRRRRCQLRCYANARADGHTLCECK